MFETKKTLLISNTRTTINGITDSLPKLLDLLKQLAASELITILIISGSHGDGGVSGFSDKKKLEPRFYEETCELVGIQSDPSKPLPKPQARYADAKDDALLRFPPYRNIKFNILNIHHFNKNGKGLLAFIEELGPSAIIVDWCYAKNGDVANLLTRAGIIARMWLRFERTSIVGLTGNGFLALDKKQTKTLRDVAELIQEGPLNGVILLGGHGTGKTLLACEFVKIKMAALGANHELFDIFCVDCGSFSVDNNDSSSSILNMLKNNAFVNDDSANDKYFYALKEFKKETGVEKITYFKELILAIQSMFEKLDENNERKKVLMLDEIPASFLFKDQSLNDAFDFEWNPNIFVVGCVSPVIGGPVIQDESDFNANLRNSDKKGLLETKNILFSRLDVTYRNSYQIQSFYNVFRIHWNGPFKGWRDRDRNDRIVRILTGKMQQPKMNPNTSSSTQNGKGTNLPSGPRPLFFITNKETRKSSDDELKELETKVSKKISGQNKSLSAICIHGYGQECTFCSSINSQFQNKDDSTPKLVHKGGFRDSSGFRGCEQNNLVVHFDYAIGGTLAFECFSRARQNLFVIISKTQLEQNETLANAIKEMLRHEEKCENKSCKDNELDKLKVVDVEYFGLNDDEVKKFENSYESERDFFRRVILSKNHNSNSANHDNDNSHLGANLGSDNSDTSSVEPESRNPNSDNDSSPEPRSCCCCLS